MAQTRPNTLIDLHDRDALASLRPLIIAHRGGVIAPDAPENSRRALALAAAQGFHAVELDVRASRDNVPVLYHGISGDNLSFDCGVEAHLRDLTAAELTALTYRATDQHIMTLDEGLAECARLQLGVMLDLKDLERKDAHKTTKSTAETAAYVTRIGELVAAHGLTRATMTIAQSPIVHRHLGIDIVHRVDVATAPDLPDAPDGPVRLWFGHPEYLSSELVPVLQRKGLLVIPAVNSFRYPKHSFNRLEEADIHRLVAAGVDGIQIDSVYRQFFA